MDNQTSSHPSGRANIGATVVLVVAVAAAAAPFLLSDEFISARLFAGSNNSPEMRLHATQLPQIDKHIADLKSETKTLNDDIYRSPKGCEASLASPFEAHVVMNPEPKRNPATESNSDNANLNKTQLLDANTAIRHLRDVKAKSGINQEDTRNAISDRASVQMRYNKASATAAMAQVAQGQWSLILLRYGSFGAI